MKFLHLADLHFGKTIYGTSLIESGDQTAWLDELLARLPQLQPDAIVVAGDVYDRANPSGDAMKLLDRFITSISNLGIPLLMISGNHDSGKKLSYADELLEKNQIYIAGTAEKEIKTVKIKSKTGDEEITFWLCPYIFPALVGSLLQDENIKDYDTAMKRLLEEQSIDASAINVLVAHQNVVQGGKEVEFGGSESLVGGVGHIEYNTFDMFDYVALGHIHSGYHVGRREVRYAGTPLCYHFDELKNPKKGAVLVDIDCKTREIKTILQEIKPLHPMNLIKNTYREVEAVLKSDSITSNYVGVILTDKRVTPEISAYFHNLVESKSGKLFELRSSLGNEEAERASDYAKGISEKPISSLFADFYREKCGDAEPTEAEEKCLKKVEELIVNSADGGANEAAEDAEVDALLKMILEE